MFSSTFEICSHLWFLYPPTLLNSISNVEEAAKETEFNIPLRISRIG